MSRAFAANLTTGDVAVDMLMTLWLEAILRKKIRLM